MPGQTLHRKLLHERVRIELLYVPYARLFPFAGQEHHGAYHCGHTGSVAHGLHAGFAVGFLVAAVVVDVVGEMLAVLVKT